MSRAWQLVLGTPAVRKEILEVVAMCQEEAGLPFDKAHEAAIGRLLVDASAGRIYLVRVRGQMAGFVSVSFQHSILLANRMSVLEKLYLLPAFRGQGLAQRVLRAVIGDLEMFGPGIVVADLEEHDPLTVVFELEGFRRIPMVRFMDTCGPEDDLPLSL